MQNYINIMETMLLMEWYKKSPHRGQRPRFWFWRDSNGNEIDLLIEEAGGLRAIEFKASQTFHSRHFSGLAWWQKVSGTKPEVCSVVYLGEQAFQTGQGALIPWRDALLPDPRT